MSISQPRLQNPCKKFIEFKGDTGVFRYWDKAAKKNVELPVPIKFIVLDELSTIKGFNEAMGCGIYSNEVHSTQRQPLTVRMFKGSESITGLYADIKPRIMSIGGKYCKSVYAAMINGDKLELVNFQLMGAASRAWMEKTVDTSTQIVCFESSTDDKKGAVKFKVPVFTGLALSKEQLAEAVVMDKALQAFLSAKRANDKDHEEEGVQADSKHENQNEPTEVEVEAPADKF